MNFSKPYNYEPLKPFENKKPSMTEPNQVMPLREMLVRYANGMPLNIPHVDSTYTEDYVKDLNAFNVLRERGLELADAEKVYSKLRSIRTKARSQEIAANVVKPKNETKQVSENQEVKQ